MSGSTSGMTRWVAALAVAVAMAGLPGCSSTQSPADADGSGTHTGHDKQDAAAGKSSAAPSTGHAGHSADPNANAAAPVSVPLRRGERFATLGVPGDGYRPAAPDGAQDDYRCFLLDPKLTARTFVTGAEVLPGPAGLVHHAILFRAEPDQIAAAERADAASPGTGWTCFGGTGLAEGASPVGSLDAAPWLSAWAPGGGENVFRGRTGALLPAGSRIVLQVHYSLRAGSGVDDTSVRLRLTPGTADLRPLETMLLVAPVELPCAPGEKGTLCDRETAVLDLMSRFGEGSGRTVSGLQLLCDGDLLAPRAGPTQHCDRRVNSPGVVRAVAGHMHLLGRSISVELNPGTDRARTLLNRPVWDFDNQRATPLKRPAKVRPGDTLRVTCTHDAALRGMLPALDGEPRYVTWGEGTSDEMCRASSCTRGTRVVGMWPRIAGLRALELGTPGEMRGRLNALVLEGRKRGTAGLLADYAREGEQLEQVGERLALVGEDGDPAGTVEVTAVDLVRFADVPWDFAASEGEGDASVEEWRDGHRQFWAGQGVEVDDDTTVVCLSFRLVEDFRLDEDTASTS